MPPPPEPSEITTHPPRAEITRKLVQPPARVYLTLNDRLYIRSRNSLANVVLRIAGRVLTPEGEIVPFSFSHTPATDRSASFASFQLAEGYLLSAVVFPSTAAPTRGQTFVEIGFVRGTGVAGDVVDVLAKDYVAEAEPLAFPGSPIRSSLEGPGAIRSITGADPAAGAEISTAVPTDARWRLTSIRALFTSDATVINRFPSLQLTNGTTVQSVYVNGVAQAASLGLFHDFKNTSNQHSSRNGTVNHVTDFPVLLAAGHVLQTSTLNIQAGDDWGAPQLLVEEWLED